jgi:predicted metalloprotease
LLFLGPTVVGLFLDNLTPPQGNSPYEPPTGSNPTTRTIPAPTGLPPLPDPATVEQRRTYLFSNALYAQTLSGQVDCTVGVDLVRVTDTDLEAYLNDFVGCLMEAWSGPVAAAGFELPRPTVTVYTEPITTRCGKSETENAFYCGADQQLYLAYDLLSFFPRLQDARFMVESIISHEFGHAVQARTGILLAEYHYEDESPTTEEADQWSRRTELQADCFAGLSLRSMAAATGLDDTDAANITQLFTLLGDTGLGGDHGQPSSRTRWINAGLASDTPNQCQTFSAAANEVE